MHGLSREREASQITISRCLHSHAVNRSEKKLFFVTRKQKRPREKRSTLSPWRSRQTHSQTRPPSNYRLSRQDQFQSQAKAPVAHLDRKIQPSGSPAYVCDPPLPPPWREYALPHQTLFFHSLPVREGRKRPRMKSINNRSDGLDGFRRELLLFTAGDKKIYYIIL